MSDDLFRPRSDRQPPPDVPPVVRDGVRYETFIGDPPQVGGLIAAYDVASSRRLWTLAVFDNVRDPGWEGDVQDIFFRAMGFDQAGLLRLADERGRHWVVDVVARTSARQA